MELDHYFDMASIEHEWLENQDSIFKAYSEVIERPYLKDSDIIILCHDDIEIWDSIEHFTHTLSTSLENPDVAFVGVAGTTIMQKDAVWWDMERRKSGLHRGFVFQGSGREDATPNYFGPPGKVAILDGLFLAAKAETLRKIGLEKPDNYEGEWDFYDIHYCSKAIEMGYSNKVIPVNILHNSPGELVGRESWLKNRMAFINSHSFPIRAK